MKKLGFFPSLFNIAFYFNGQSTYFAVYIDNLQILGPDLSLINKPKLQLASKFKTSDLSIKAHYLGIRVSREKDTITVTQTVYIDQLLKTPQMGNCNPVSTPMAKSLCLTLFKDDFVPDPKNVSAYKQYTERV